MLNGAIVWWRRTEFTCANNEINLYVALELLFGSCTLLYLQVRAEAMASAGRLYDSLVVVDTKPIEIFIFIGISMSIMRSGVNRTGLQCISMTAENT